MDTTSKEDKFWSRILKPFGSVGYFSARYPIHTIIVSLVISAVAYLSVVSLYIHEWELFFQSVKIPSEWRGTSDMLSKCTHYYKMKDSYKDWEIISMGTLESFKDEYDHYYLYPLNFHSSFHTKVDYPQVTNTIYQFENTKYILLRNLIPFDKLFSTESSNWELMLSKDSLFEIYQEVFFSLRDTMVSNKLDSTDLLLLSLSYLMMIYTIINVFNEMREIGSKFWLTVCTLLNSLCALFLALVTVRKFFLIQITTMDIIRGLPFLIVVIGFRNKVALASYIMKRFGIINISKKITIEKVIQDAIAKEGDKLLKEYSLALVSFTVCVFYLNNLEAIRNFAILSIFILIFDFVLTITFFSAILSLKMEINSIHRATIIRQTLEEEGTSKTASRSVSSKEDEIHHTYFLHSNSTVLMSKILIVSFIVIINIYNINFYWFFSIVQLGYTYFNHGTLPNFITTSTDLNSTGNVVVSVVPTQYYHYHGGRNEPNNIIYIISDALESAIHDKFISKILLIILLSSISTNIYLLQAAKVHTEYTVSALYRNILSQENVASKSKQFTPPNVRNAIRLKSLSPLPVSLTPPTFSLASSDDDIHSDSSELSTPWDEDNDITFEKLENLMKQGQLATLNDNQIASLVLTDKLPLYALENKLGNKLRAVKVRRDVISAMSKSSILKSKSVPYENYDYDRVYGTCCENVIGYVPIPVGIIGPMIIDDKPYHIPMATTEGCLVASAMRGCKAINLGGGVTTVLTKDGMTRGPCVRFPSLKRAGSCKIWLDSPKGQEIMKKTFNSTSRFARLQHIHTALAGDLLFIRFRTTTGDAMGMNMISKGVEHCLHEMVKDFGWFDMEVIALSGNYCTDKKAAAINWIDGRGKSVVAEAIIPKDVVKRVLKSDVKSMVELNISKNLVGSAVAGAIGGFNAHAANIVTALYIALGQDPAQNVESSNCITLMKELGGNLKISVSMPSIEVGTIGGGTILEAQSALLNLLGVRGPHPTIPGENAQTLARIVASSVLAGELSLCAALAAGQLVKSHMTLNRPSNLVTEPTDAV